MRRTVQIDFPIVRMIFRIVQVDFPIVPMDLQTHQIEISSVRVSAFQKSILYFLLFLIGFHMKGAVATRLTPWKYN
ncbi:MAG: hypothetical protein V5A59_13885 [Bacteroidales bacterium]